MGEEKEKKETGEGDEKEEKDKLKQGGRTQVSPRHDR